MFENLLTFDVYIFDFDGIIVDTEKNHNICWNSVLNINFDYTHYCKLFHTETPNDAKNNLEKNYGIINFEELSSKKKIIYNQMLINKQIQLIDGVKQFLIFLKQNNKTIIIATNANKKDVEFVFNNYIVDVTPDDIISCEMIKNKKPSPEIYNIIHAKYGFEKKYVVFEDSLSGITAVYKSSINNCNNLVCFLNNLNYVHYSMIMTIYNPLHITTFDGLI
jgi:HAD superfamily hydrolase (TIGR01509 family)